MINDEFEVFKVLHLIQRGDGNRIQHNSQIRKQFCHKNIQSYKINGWQWDYILTILSILKLVQTNEINEILLQVRLIMAVKYKCCYNKNWPLKDVVLKD